MYIKEENSEDFCPNYDEEFGLLVLFTTMYILRDIYLWMHGGPCKQLSPSIPVIYK